MKELKIYEFQAKQIEDTFRMVANLLKSRNKETSLDRDIMQSWEYIKNVLKGDIDIKVTRFSKINSDLVLKDNDIKKVIDDSMGMRDYFNISDENKLIKGIEGLIRGQSDKIIELEKALSIRDKENELFILRINELTK